MPRKPHTRSVEPELARNPRVQALYKALLVIGKDEELLARFLRDLLTYEETLKLANRWAVASVLLSKETHARAAETLKISPKTISTVARFVTGPFATGGFRDVFERLQPSQAQHADKSRP